MLEALFVPPTSAAITAALAGARVEGRLAVVGDARLAAALSTGRREVLAVGVSGRAARKLSSQVADLSSVEDRSLAAVIGTDVATDPDWEHRLRGWARVVRDGGAIVFVDRGHAVEASRRALCAGLCEIAQRHAGRSVVTSGVVTHLG